MTTLNQAVVPVPTLSAKGWVDAPSEKADYLIAHFFASDTNQSYLYDGSIANFQILLKLYGDDLTNLKQNLRMTLETYLGHYYADATLEIGDDTSVNQTDTVILIIYCAVIENGIQYIFSNLLTLLNGKFQNISKVNNTGARPALSFN